MATPPDPNRSFNRYIPGTRTDHSSPTRLRTLFRGSSTPGTQIYLAHTCVFSSRLTVQGKEGVFFNEDFGSWTHFSDYCFTFFDEY